MALFSTSVPVLEMHLSNEPLALVHFPDRRLQYFKIKNLGDPNYFILYTKKIKGIFRKDPARTWFMGKTPIYYIDSKNCKPFDPILVNELNHFAKKNKLHVIKRTDVRHAGWLRIQLGRFNGHKKPKEPTKEEKKEAMEAVRKMAGDQQEKIDEEIEALRKEVNETEKAQRQQGETITIAKVPDAPKGYVLLDRLTQKELISVAEKDILEERLKADQLSFNELLLELRRHEAIQISEPIDAKSQLFIEEFSTDDPNKLANFVEWLTSIDKAEKRMTSVPVKNWIPGTVILFGAIGIIMFLVMLPQIVGSIEQVIEGTGGGGGIKLPFGLFLSKLFGL